MSFHLDSTPARCTIEESFSHPTIPTRRLAHPTESSDYFLIHLPLPAPLLCPLLCMFVVTVQSTPFVEHRVKAEGTSCRSSSDPAVLRAEVDCNHTEPSTGKTMLFPCLPPLPFTHRHCQSPCLTDFRRNSLLFSAFLSSRRPDGLRPTT
ncbi:unnamed protein product [Protopolystoma xenopodis]|uniref:Uncharacterized protein n=1 Tax=Protopolystoma xenopodis TaxID=117903 RepID=A0A3S5FFG5_9PLAT|nr:unnamed protein product [Protopolystoma xenopodis]